MQGHDEAQLAFRASQQQCPSSAARQQQSKQQAVILPQQQSSEAYHVHTTPQQSVQHIPDACAPALCQGADVAGRDAALRIHAQHPNNSAAGFKAHPVA